jgi:DNA replication ATP-dependent helicase Dna2
MESQGQLEVSTVDRYQGRDKLCIIVSLVRSNSDKQVGMLLRDWRRINVAFTRAKAKLVVIGSKSTLQSAPMLNSFVKLADERKWTVQLQSTDEMTATATQLSQSPAKAGSG